MNCVLRQNARILEDDRPNRRLTSPVCDLLVLFSRCSERIESRNPTWICPSPIIEVWKRKCRLTVFTNDLRQRLGAEQLERAGERSSKWRGIEASRLSRFLE